MSEETRKNETVPAADALADDMRRRLLRCAELSAFAIWLRRQMAETMRNEHAR